MLFDPGTYKYNTEDKYLNFYHGTRGHNTITIGDHDQMLKGGRFIWYYWTKAFDQKINETNATYEFEGKIKVFPELSLNIIHHRKVIKYKSLPKWQIIDIVSGYDGDLPIVQHWNLADGQSSLRLPLGSGLSEDELSIQIQSYDKDGQVLKKEYQKGWYSEKYGIKENFNQLIFKTDKRFIETNIEIIQA